MKHSDWQWLIEPAPSSKGYILKYKKPTVWTECNRFDTPEEAANAVSNRTTGQAEWDQRTPEAAIPGLAGWLIDPSGPLSQVLPIVSNLLGAMIAPPPSQRGESL